MKGFDKLKIKRFSISAICIVAVLLIAALFSLTAKSQIMIEYSDSTDSSVFLYVARSILNGEVPYRDTFDHKGPLMYLLNVIALSISPEVGLWIVELATLSAAFLIMYKLSCLFCKNTTSVFVVLSIVPALARYFDGGNLIEEYALPFIAGALYIFTDYFLNNKITKLRLVICGICLGAVLMLRINMIAVWMVMCIGVLWQCLFNRDYKRIWFFLRYFLLGLFVSIVPFLIWLMAKGALKEFWNDYFIFNLFYSSDSERANSFAKLNSFSSFLHYMWTTIALSVTAVSYLKKKRMLDLLYLFCLLVTLLLICISGQLYSHYGMSVIPLLVAPLAYIGKSCEDSWDKDQFSNILIVICLMAYMVLPTWQTLFDNAVASHKDYGLDKTNTTVAAISSWIQENTSPDDKIIVCGNWNVIYNESERFAASQYSYQTPICIISEEMEKEFYEELNENKPAAIVLPSDYYAYGKMQNFIDTYGYILATNDSVAGSYALYLLP